MTTLTINGTSYSYPADEESAGWGAVATEAMVQLTNNVLYKNGGAFTLTADTNWGSSYGHIAAHFTTASSSAADSGVLRLANDEEITWRNNADAANLVLKANTSNQLEYEGNRVYTADLFTATSAGAADAGKAVILNGNGVLDDTLVSVASEFLRVDGTQALTAAWDAGSYDIQAETFTSDVATGTAPFTVSSTTLVTNLNADMVDGIQASSFFKHDGTVAMTGNIAMGANSITGVDNLTMTGNITCGGYLLIRTLSDPEGEYIQMEDSLRLKSDTSGGINRFDTDGTLSDNSDNQVATQRAVKTYVDNNTELSNDTTPQLGGDLDLNGNNIDFPTTANISDCLDEDTMSSNSATVLCTQQSIKAYADLKLAMTDLDDTPADDAETAVTSKWVYDNIYNANLKWGYFNINAGDFYYPTSNFAPLNTRTATDVTFKEHLFDASTAEYVEFAFDLPANLASGTVTFLAKVSASTADGNEIQLRFEHAAVGDDEDIDSVSYTAEDSGDFTTSSSQNDIDHVSWTETVANLGWSANDRIFCKVSRQSIDDGSALASDLGLLSFRIQYPIL